ncbi:MAG: hypothetical protein VX615_03485 [Planctomycetota bacterium]|nr:hypothetical protein [Planctomycetota bacterium]
MFICGLMIAAFSVKPLCTPAQFNETIGPHVEYDQELIVQAIFEQYGDDTRRLIAPIDDKLPRKKKLEIELERAVNADEQFDILLSSLEVLDSRQEWQNAIIKLRRDILLEERSASNPWVNTPWVNFTGNDPTVIAEVDAFLIQEIDADRQDRYQAFIARAEGNPQLCKEYETKVMKRWVAFEDIIMPFEEHWQLSMYPQLDSGDDIHQFYAWSIDNLSEEAILDAIHQQYLVWETLHRNKNNAVVSEVRKARRTHHFDPWSNGCGYISSQENQIKNKLLIASAEIDELNKNSIQAMLGLCSEEERSEFLTQHNEKQ